MWSNTWAGLGPAWPKKGTTWFRAGLARPEGGLGPSLNFRLVGPPVRPN
jgi:hypothetical protein